MTGIVITTEDEYRAACDEVDRLMNTPEDPDEDHFRIYHVISATTKYRAIHHPVKLETTRDYQAAKDEIRAHFATNTIKGHFENGRLKDLEEACKLFRLKHGIHDPSDHWRPSDADVRR